ncbi:SAM hydroxide adenosyltransferase [Rickettsiales endosymbiont of Trichoplax sp. H2]|uniref:SAM hydroxide adenosyltransferase n=1 Tax=Rickettsiales endosymbiont of Trichoplax sp. H2 TaxID=2021221 RepID=UPI0012B3C453|nr:SAM hydroxide adenosyltransferase [Rickettsiales endosymbiont of Trichoplax sp. H2]MSO13301.1 hypothetical protein [Rickettsiales endosymbiont of Trichoplax sp. H2]
MLPDVITMTSHGRDLYVYVATRFASEKIKFAEIGDKLSTEIVKISLKKAEIKEDSLVGNIISYDIYGNIWTNINLDIIKQYNFKVNNEYLLIIFFNQDKYFEKIVRFFNTFADAKLEEELLYINSISCLGVATNQANLKNKIKLLMV